MRIFQTNSYSYQQLISPPHQLKINFWQNNKMARMKLRNFQLVWGCDSGRKIKSPLQKAGALRIALIF